MPHTLYNLENTNHDEFLQAFKDIPIDEDTLILSKNNLADKSTAELVEAFALIPGNITSVNLFGNYLGYSKTAYELRQILLSLPTSVTTLDLRANSLENQNPANLQLILQSLPPALTVINMGNNKLSIHPDTGMLAINETLTSKLVLSRKIPEIILPILSAVKQGLFTMDFAQDVLSHVLSKNLQPKAFISKHISKLIYSDDSAVLKSAFQRNGGSVSFFANLSSDNTLKALEIEANKDRNNAAHRTLQHFVLR